MLDDRPLVAILGLSKGGTNHLAQLVHACEGVVGLDERVSRLIQPTRKMKHQILTADAVASGILRPLKPLEQAKVIAVNKVNYSLVSYPEAWAKFLSDDVQSRTIVLLRNPLMVHQSRLAYVRGTKPQRTRWLDPRQLARELAELLALAWHLPQAEVVFHERGLVDRYRQLLTGPLGLTTSGEIVIEDCPTCGGGLERRQRHADPASIWLYCTGCAKFAEGAGNYNYIRRPDDPQRYRRQEASLRNDDTIGILTESLGRGPIDLFLEGQHWSDDGSQALRDCLNRDADRWRAVPLNDTLYPY